MHSILQRIAFSCLVVCKLHIVVQLVLLRMGAVFIQRLRLLLISHKQNIWNNALQMHEKNSFFHRVAAALRLLIHLIITPTKNVKSQNLKTFRLSVCLCFIFIFFAQLNPFPLLCLCHKCIAKPFSRIDTHINKAKYMNMGLISVLSIYLKKKTQHKQKFMLQDVL